jgi:hypothetical protein
MAGAALLAAALGCGEGGEFSSGDVSGQVRGQSFTFFSGSAEPDGAGGYVVTLADSTGFDCDSGATPSATYLTVVVDSLDEPGTYPATDAVTFNRVSDGVIDPATATSGDVTVDSIDEAAGTLDGSIDASGPDSEVAGAFSVPLCE